jgi:O-antigen/teichoic acid export membrane protein
MREYASPESFRRLTSAALQYSSLAIGALAVILTAVAPELVQILAPSEFAGAALMVAPLTYAALFQAVATIASASVFIARRPELGLITNGAAFAANTFVAVLAVPRLGGVGAALGVLAGYAVLAVGYGLAFGAVTPLRGLPWGRLSSIFLATGIAVGAALLLIEAPLAIRTLLVPAYVVTLIGFRAIGSQEYAAAKAFVYRRVR